MVNGNFSCVLVCVVLLNLSCFINLKLALVDFIQIKKGTLSLFFIMLLGLVEVLFKR
jgi:hypothetical protein